MDHSRERKGQGQRPKEPQEGQCSRKGLRTGEDGGGEAQRIDHRKAFEFNSK